MGEEENKEKSPYEGLPGVVSSKGTVLAVFNGGPLDGERILMIPQVHKSVPNEMVFSRTSADIEARLPTPRFEN